MTAAGITVGVVALLATSNYLAYRLGAAMARTRRARKDMRHAAQQWRIVFKILRTHLRQLVTLAAGAALLAALVLAVIAAVVAR